MGSNHAASTRTFLVPGVIIVSQPPMTPARPRGFGVIGDDEVFWIERSFYSVEGLEFFSFAGATHHDAAFDFVEVEGVGRLAHGEPCEVCGVDGVGDFLLLEEFEVGVDLGAGKPVARVGDGDAAENAGGEAAAGIFGVDADGEDLLGRCMCGKGHLEGLQFDAVNGGGFARDAVVVHGIDAVGGDVHLEERTVAVAERINALDRDAAESQVFGKLGVGDGEFGQIGTEPPGENLHANCPRKRISPA